LDDDNLSNMIDINNVHECIINSEKILEDLFLEITKYQS